MTFGRSQTGVLIALLLVLAPVVAPIWAAAPARADCAFGNAECSFLSWMAMFNITSPQGTQGLIDMGRGVCTDMQNGYSFAQERGAVRQAYPSLSTVQIGRLMDNAIGSFCPNTPMPLS
jgi:Protein of unknown function (DUF732)